MVRKGAALLMGLALLGGGGLVCGCGQATQPSPPQPAAQTPLPTVQMTVPAQAKAGTPLLLQVRVTRNGSPVNQLDDVMFEVWPDKPDAQHWLMHAKRTGDGVYSASYTFPAPGKYWVMYHVIDHGNMVMTAPQSVQVNR
jgi:hypothetical protein